MKKFLLTVFAAFASLSFAGVPNFLESLDVGLAIDFSKPETSRACADFSGTWKSLCDNSAQVFTIKQKGCEALEVSSPKMKMPLAIGGVVSFSGVLVGAPGISFGSSINSFWNKEQNVLHVNVMGGHKKLAIDEAGEGGYMFEEVALEGEKLKISIKVKKPTGEGSGTCLFEKQAS